MILQTVVEARRRRNFDLLACEESVETDTNNGNYIARAFTSPLLSQIASELKLNPSSWMKKSAGSLHWLFALLGAYTSIQR